MYYKWDELFICIKLINWSNYYKYKPNFNSLNIKYWKKLILICIHLTFIFVYYVFILYSCNKVALIIRFIIFCQTLFLLVVSIPYAYLKCVFDVLNVNSLYSIYFERDEILFWLLNPSSYSHNSSYYISLLYR